MHRKTGLSVKIAVGYSVIVLLTVVVGGLGWYGVDKLHRQIMAFSLWVNVDTVLHNTITAEVSKLEYGITTYTDSPTKERFDALMDSLARIDMNIQNWHR